MNYNYGFNPKKYLPYQRNFLFFNSVRSTGKTYTTQGFFIERFLEKGEKFIYIVRTKNEIKDGVFEKAFTKVLAVEFADHEFDFKKNMLYINRGDVKEVVGYAVALTEVTKKKKENLDGVRWLMFDEYIIDENSTANYINGWKEPELVLNLYHTIDRERDYVTCFFLANTIKFYNPYHMHPAFNIRHCEIDKVFVRDNVLYLYFSPSETVKQVKKKSKFLKMLAGTNYGGYAADGDFINDSETFVCKMNEPCTCHVTVTVDGVEYGVWRGLRNPIFFFSQKLDIGTNTPRYCLNKKDMSMGKTLLTRAKPFNLVMLSEFFKKGAVFFESHEIQEKLEDFIRYLL